MKQTTAKNFSSQLKAITKSAITQRENAQSILEFGFERYKENGDTGYLTRTVQACIGVRSLDTQKMVGYVKSIANVKYVKSSDGSKVFKKIKDQLPEAAGYTLEKWFNFEVEKTATTAKKSKLDKAVDAINALDDKDRVILFKMFQEEEQKAA